jgi:oligosaccharide repeat unit polymerase
MKHINIGDTTLSDLLYSESNKGFKFRIDNFILLFYVFYLLISLLGYTFINYISISVSTIFIYLIYVLFLFFGAFIGIRLDLRNVFPQIKIKINNSFVNKFSILFGLVTVLIWTKFITEYGSIEAIIANAYNIRENTIGESDSIIPLWLTYLSSIEFAFFTILLVLYQKNKKYLWAIIYMFIVIILNDLQTFGRIGILFSIFSVIGWIIFNRKKIVTIKNFIYTFLLYNLLMLPRLIRGGFDNFSGTIDNYSAFFLIKISPYFYGLTSIYIYYFSSIFAFNQLFNTEINHLYGFKNFAPLINIISRLFPFLSIERIQLIEPMAQIPFEYNIYSILGDIYIDYGIVGFFILPIIFGFIIGSIFRSNGLFFDALKILMFAWIFYSPIYNCFSFGSFFISFVFLVLLSVFFKES